MRVLDAGCGPGTIALLVAKKAREVVAVDASPAMLSAARENARVARYANLQFMQRDVGDPGLADLGAFDAIICSSVLEYVEDPEPVLEGFSRMLREDGVLILSMPNRRSIYRAMERLLFRLMGRPRYLAFVANRWTQQRVTAVLISNEFRIAEAVHYGQVPGLSRIFGWLRVPQYADTLYAIVAVKRNDGQVTVAREP